jgi:uncharacterized protein (DUF1697 family)
VQTFISSGNVLFESEELDKAVLEEKIEKTLPQKLQFQSQTIIRSKNDLEELLSRNPFSGMTHSKKTSLNVSFLKENKKVQLQLAQKGEGYKILASLKGAICFVVDTTTTKTPIVMSLLEKEFNKKITTRTYNTVSKIHALM